MSDGFSINRFGAINPIAAKGSQAAGGPKQESLLDKPAPGDSVSFSNRLGTNSNLTIAGVPIKLDPSSLHASTLNTLKNPPEHSSAFPPFTDVNS